MQKDAFINSDCDELIRKVESKHAPIFAGYKADEQRAISLSIEGVAFRHCKHDVLNRK